MPPELNDIISIALQHHQQGQLQSAEAGYRQVLTADPQHPDALHLLGVLARQSGLIEPAIDLITRAIDVNPSVATYYCNLSEALLAAGRDADAGRNARQAISLQPQYPEAKGNLAAALLGLQQWDEAEREVREAIAMRPDNANFHNTLGQVLRETERRDDAIEAYRRAVQVDPQHAHAHSNLGQMLLESNRAVMALEHCWRATQLQPQLAEAQSNLGNVLRELGRLDDAKQAYQRALELNPKLPMVHNNIGQILQEEGFLAEAAKWYLRALEGESDNVRFHVNYASLLVDQENWPAAEERFARAQAIDPNHAGCLVGIGKMRVCRELYQPAIESFQAALRTDDQCLAAKVQLAHTFNLIGDRQRAISAFRSALDQDPHCPGALAGMGVHYPAELDAANEQQMWEILSDPELSPSRRAPLHCGLASLLDRRGDYARAAEQSILSNALLKVDFQRRGKGYNSADFAARIDQLINAFTVDRFSRLSDAAASDDPTPVFIVGMPRSGTTLTEQILASHPEVHGAGELNLVFQSVHRLSELIRSDQTPIDLLNGSDPQTLRGQLATLAQEHLTQLRQKSVDHRRITDKMPDNYLNLGWISLLFPGARIIHCRRDLRDVATSCWMTNFQKVRWANDFQQIQSRCEQYLKLMSHWRRVLPLPLLEIDYEETVQQTEATARRLVEWIGLDWDDACLNFHQTERPVHTASVTQVRQPIYRGSVGRWHNYRDFFSELYEPLTAHIEAQ